jgi:cytochrome c5
VTNYASVNDAVNGHNPAQTVAMEFSPQNGISGTAYTKFYVFNNDSTISQTAKLDDFGPKFVPTLCIVCHNGNVNSMGPDGNLGPTARFIPFDLQSFQYDPSKLRSAQESEFKELNRAILKRTNATVPLQVLIQQWYGSETDPNLPSPTFIDADPATKTTIPSAWTSPDNRSTLYTAVVMTSCRSCHNTRDPGPPNNDLAWDSFENFNTYGSLIKLVACTSPGNHIMPQAERTFARFWLSTNPNAPATLAGAKLQGFQGQCN